jgi:hypothetical protein
MKFTTSALLLSLTTSITAQTTQSYSFELAIQSSNKTLDGKTLISCHEGAALEGLCITSNSGHSGSLYQFNTSNAQTADPYLGKTGVLTYELSGNNFKGQ